MSVPPAPPSPSFDERIERLRSLRPPWWLYDSVLIALALLVIGASLALVPGEDLEFVYFRNGMRFGDTCLFLAQTGYPCPQCGMTRSFVYAVRGDLVASFLYSPGGLGLFLWSQFAGVLGLARLAKRDPRSLQLPWQVIAGWSILWTIGLYLAPYVLRLYGINPLP